MPAATNQNDFYTHALEHVRYEGQLLWQVFGAFLLPHTIFLAFLLQSAFAPEPGYKASVFFPALLGALLCLPWFAAYSRGSDYYIFRMAQAKALEPPDSNLLRGLGEQFSAGKAVVLEGKSYRVKWFARALRTKRSVPLLVGSFWLTYALLVIWRGPW